MLRVRVGWMGMRVRVDVGVSEFVAVAVGVIVSVAEGVVRY
jgi:hypothetical protein